MTHEEKELRRAARNNIRKMLWQWGNTIRKVDKNDEAEYVCIAENKAGEQDASIHLKVFGKDSAVKVIALPRFL